MPKDQVSVDHPAFYPLMISGEAQNIDATSISCFVEIPIPISNF